MCYLQYASQQYAPENTHVIPPKNGKKRKLGVEYVLTSKPKDYADASYNKSYKTQQTVEGLESMVAHGKDDHLLRTHFHQTAFVFNVLVIKFAEVLSVHLRLTWWGYEA